MNAVDETPTSNSFTTGGTIPNSKSLSFSNTGTFYWQAVYSGDTNNNKATSPCNEVLVIGPNSPSLSTTLHDETTGTSAAGGTTLNVTVGDVVHDSASLTGATAGPTNGASITYHYYTDSSCTMNAVDETPASPGNEFTTQAGSASVIPNSKTVTFGSPGTFYYQAVYSGDTNNNKATSLCNEKVVVTAPPPVSQITPTQTTCAQFAGGTSSTLSSITYSLKQGIINQVSPGVFFYWVKVSSAGTYYVTETPKYASNPFLIGSGSNVYTFNAATGTCTALTNSITQPTGTGLPPGTVKVTFSSGTGPFYIGIKYSTGNVKGETAPSNPVDPYLFTTYLTSIPSPLVSNTTTQEIDLNKT
jgi:hypothetical protein